MTDRTPPSDDEPDGATHRVSRHDELLSAAIDGALVEAVRDLGADPSETAALESSVSRARQAELAHAGMALSAVPALDELTRTRLVRGALAAVSPVGDVVPTQRVSANRRRWRAPAAAAAAAIALAGGVGVALRDDGRQVASEETSDAFKAETFAPLAGGGLTDYGPLEPSDLARITGANGPVGETGTLASDVERMPSDTALEEPATPEGTDAELTGCLTQLNPGGATPQVIGTAEIDGNPVYVAVADEPGRRLGYAFTVVPCRIAMSNSANL